MSNRIPPLIQIFKRILSHLVLRMMGIDFLPELDTQEPEIGAYAAGLSILTIELATLGESSLDQGLHHCRRIDERHHARDTFRMELAAESLEL
jgi:hypothetical protein